MLRKPRYLRIILTAQCPMACSFCHMEGDPADGGERFGLGLEELCAYLRVAVLEGIQKFKFLGGEPLIRKDLSEAIRFLRTLSPTADISVITAGIMPPSRLEAAFDAGLSRANLSIHGWTAERIARHGGSPKMHQNRQDTLDLLLRKALPLKLNYVYSGPEVEDDLRGFLEWAAETKVLVNLLDNLQRPDYSAQTLLDVLQKLVGPWQAVEAVPDPYSLPTHHFLWATGLRIEIKTEELGSQYPWASCSSCPVRSRCREGIYALRLTHQGHLRLCMDRPDLQIPLRPLLPSGLAALRGAWASFVTASLPAASFAEISPFPPPPKEALFSSFSGSENS